MVHLEGQVRFAGLLYVLTAIAGSFAMGYVPDQLISSRERSGDNRWR